LTNRCYKLHNIKQSSLIEISFINLKIVKTDRDKFRLRCVHHSAGSSTSFHREVWLHSPYSVLSLRFLRKHAAWKQAN